MVTSGTVVGNGGMGSIEGKEIVVIGHGCRCPARFGSMAGRAVGTQADLLMVGVSRLVEIILVAADAFGGCAGISVGMTGEAFQTYMGSRERKVRLVVVEDLLFLTGGMASEARCCRIRITRDRLMVLIGGRLVVFMAFDAAECRKVILLDVAGRARIPGAGMGAGIDRKKLAIVITEIGRFPAHVGGMTTLAVSREPGLKVIRVDGRLEILLVAGNAIRGNVAIVVADMAAGTFIDGMAFGQREKVVVKAIGYPAKGICVVALRTVGRESCLAVVGLGRSQVVLLMAGDAGRIDGVEA